MSWIIKYNSYIVVYLGSPLLFEQISYCESQYSYIPAFDRNSAEYEVKRANIPKPYSVRKAAGWAGIGVAKEIPFWSYESPLTPMRCEYDYVTGTTIGSEGDYKYKK